MLGKYCHKLKTIVTVAVHYGYVSLHNIATRTTIFDCHVSANASRYRLQHVPPYIWMTKGVIKILLIYRGYYFSVGKVGVGERPLLQNGDGWPGVLPDEVFLQVHTGLFCPGAPLSWASNL